VGKSYPADWKAKRKTHMVPVCEQEFDTDKKVYLWLVHENTEHLILILERYVEMAKMQGLGAFLIKASQALGQYVIGISSDAFIEIFYLLVCMDRLNREGDDRSRKEALFHLENIRKLLSLDELFGSVRSTHVIESGT